MDYDDRNDQYTPREPGNDAGSENAPENGAAGPYQAGSAGSTPENGGVTPDGTHYEHVGSSNFTMRSPAPGESREQQGYYGPSADQRYSAGSSAGGSSYSSDSWNGYSGGSRYTSSDYDRHSSRQSSTAYSASGNDSSSADAGGWNGNGGNDGNGPQDPGFGGYYGAPQQPQQPARAGKSTVINLSRRAFVLILILCMVITSAATFGMLAAYDHYTSTNNGSATNYKLTKSNEKLDYKSIIKKAQDSVVSITTESVSTDIWAQNYVTEGAGSGVIIQSNGYIITCQHVVDGARKITVKLHNGKTYSASLVGADEDNDIAVIKIKARNLHAATYGDSSKLQVGDNVVAIGNPLGELGGTATTGIISASKRDLTIDGKKMELIQTDASINPGNSGGGLFDASGNLIGIVEAKSSGSDVEGLGFANPINTAAKVAKNLIQNEGKSSSNSSSKSSTPKIGVSVAELTENQAKQYGYDSAGLYISSVSGMNAYKAGLRSGDRIVAVDGKEISSYDELKSLLQKHKAGDKIKIQISRKGQMKTVTTKLS